jgi:cytidyltransferase-like protein
VRTLLTIGTFDVPHMGHATFLRKCERYADLVMVGVNTDSFVVQYKGKAPAFDQGERMAVIRHLGYAVKLNDGPGRDLIHSVRPHVIAIGSDWLRRDYLAQIHMTADELERMECSLLYLPYTPGISTSSIKERLD